MDTNKKPKRRFLSNPFKKMIDKIGSRPTSPSPDGRSEAVSSAMVSRVRSLLRNDPQMLKYDGAMKESTLAVAPALYDAQSAAIPGMAGAGNLDEIAKTESVEIDEVAANLGEDGPSSAAGASPAPVVTITGVQDKAPGASLPENQADRTDVVQADFTEVASAAVPSMARRAGSLAYEGVKESLRLIVRVTDAVPVVKSATQGVLEVFERFDDVTGVPGELVDLKEKLDALAVILENNDVLAIRDRLSGLARMFEEKTRIIVLKLERNIAARIIESTEDIKFMSREIRAITFAIEIVMMDVNLRTNAMVSNLHHIALLDKLKYVEGAGFDHEDRQGCANGTRMLLLADLLTWATEPKSEHVFWLNGMAGTGKTAVAETLCNLLSGKGILGSSFFCSRKTTDRRKMNLILPSLASALAYKYPEFQKELVLVLQNCLDPTGMDLEKQLKTLLIDPSRIAFANHPGSIVLVVDALDECEDQQAAEMFLKLILKERSPGCLRFFVTSRPETKIRKGFSAGAHAGLRLQDIEEHIVKADIRVYLQTSFEEIDDLQSEYSGQWPPAELDVIVENSGNLFIYAATAVKYISDDRGDPVERLRKYASITPPPNAVEAIDEVYLFVLRDTFSKLDSDEKNRILLCLQTVVCAFEPLSVTMYSTLLGISVVQVRRAFASLHSVVQMPDEKKNDHQIALYHASFPDYLTSASRTNSAAWHVDIVVGHAVVASQCLQVMMSKLHFNVAKASTSYKSNKDQHLEVPFELIYTCGSWTNHIFSSFKESNQFPVMLASKIEEFLSNKFLFWLEVLSVSDKVQYASASLSHLYQITDSPVLKEMCREFATFISKHLVAIKYSTPHIYLSALPWVASNSILGKTYLPKFTNLPKIVDSKEPDDWEPLVIQLLGHENSVNCIAFSPDGKHLASGSDDETIRVWNAETGQQILEIVHDKINIIYSIAISPDGKYIVSGSTLSTVHIWYADSGTEACKPLEGHSDCINSVAFSPDGSLIASGSGDNEVRIWSFDTKETLFKVQHKDVVNCVLFSPDSKYLASASDDKTIKIWSTETGNEIKTLKGHTDCVICLAYSPDGTYLASGGSDTTVRIWNSETGKQKYKALRGHKDTVDSVCFSSNGKYIVSAGGDPIIKIWGFDSGKEAIKLVKEHYSAVTCVTYSCSGRLFASGSADKRICIWELDAEKRSLKFSISEHSNSVTSLVFSMDDNYLFSGSEDGTIKKWNTNTGEQEPFDLQSHYSVDSKAVDIEENTGSDTESDLSLDTRCNVLSLVYSPDGKDIISATHDSTIRIWNAQTGEPRLKPLQGHTAEVLSVDISSNGKYIGSGSSDKTVRIWDAKSGKQIHKALRGHHDSVLSVAFSMDSQVLVSGSEDSCIRVWDVKTGTLLTENQLNKDINGGLYDIALSPNGQHVLCALSMYALKTWGLTTKQEDKIFSGHTDEAFCVAFSHDGKYILSGSADYTVRVWNSETGEEICAPLHGHSDSILSVSFSPDRNYIASGSCDSTIQIWHISEIFSKDSHIQKSITQMGSNDKINSKENAGNDTPLTGHSNYILSVAFSPNGKLIASASDDYTVGVWDVDTGILVYPFFKDHTNFVGTVAWSPDGKLIASGCDDGFIRLWNAETGLLDSKLKGHSAEVNCVAFSPNGHNIASCSNDKTVRIWSIATKKQTCKSMQGHSDSVNSVAYSPNGELIVSTSDDETLRVWNAEKGTNSLKCLRGHDDAVCSALFSPNGQYIVSGSCDRYVNIWDAKTFKLLKELKGHDAEVLSIAITSDSKYILSGSTDLAICTWDLETGKSIGLPLIGHGSSITSISVSSDRNLVASGSDDCTIRTWNLMEPLSLLNRSLSEPSTFHNYSPRPDLNYDGWCFLEKHLFLWISPAKFAFVYTPQTQIIIGKRRIIIELDNFAHGEDWASCGLHL